MKRFGITGKIWLSIGVFVLGFVLSIALGQIGSFRTEHALRSASEALFPAAQRSQEAEAAFQGAVKGFRDAVLVQDASGLDRASQDGQTVVASLQAIANIKGLPQQRAAMAADLANAVRQFVPDARSTYSLMLGAATAMNPETQDHMQKLAGRTDTLQHSLQVLKNSLTQDLHAQLNTTKSASVTQRWVSVLDFAGTLVIAFVIVNLTITRAITGPIMRVIKGVQRAAEGAAQASDEMAASGQVVARDAQQQAAYIEEISASLEEISATTRKNADHASDADKLMRQAGSKVERAGKAMQDLTGSMSAISKSSRQVSDVLKSIDEIAFHTNILALNAAVEAARAGEAGAGFSVVADEVRSLAQRAAEAARRSADIIDKTIKDVAAGVQLVTAVEQAFTEVSSGIAGGGTVVAQIATSSQEQARGVSQIGQAISRISQVTQNNAVNANKTAEVASNMGDQVASTRRHLDELVAVVGAHKE